MTFESLADYCERRAREIRADWETKPDQLAMMTQWTASVYSQEMGAARALEEIAVSERSREK